MVRVFKHDDPEWLSLLDSIPHDIYHHPAYCSLTTDRSEHTVAVYIADERGWFFLPLILRELVSAEHQISMGYDAISPYGYPGPLFHVEPAVNAERFARDCIVGLGVVLREKGIVSTFIRCNPLQPPHEALRDHGEFVLHGNTIAIDLEKPADDVEMDMRKNIRYDIRTARKKEEYTFLIDEKMERLDQFIELYEDTMRRRDADDFYFFDSTYYERLKTELKEHVSLLAILHGDQMVAGALFLTARDLVHYHLSGTATDYMSENVNKLLLDEAWRYFQSLSYKKLHLGGGVGAKKDGLYRFKAGFSSLRLPFYTWRLIIDEHAYDDLTERAGVDLEAAEGFFPLYRAGSYFRR